MCALKMQMCLLFFQLNMTIICGKLLSMAAATVMIVCVKGEILSECLHLQSYQLL